MDAGLVALAVSIVGVVGTLVAPVLAQRSVARAARSAAELDRLARDEEWRTEERRRSHEELRTTFTKLNSLGRASRNAIGRCARQYRDTGALAPEDLFAAEAAFEAYLSEYDQAQMILPAEVLKIASDLNTLLYHAYKDLETLGNEGAKSSEEMIEYSQTTIYGAVSELRSAMRKHLNVE